jgi:ribosomal-protein-alanine N-acetyltransferase
VHVNATVPDELREAPLQPSNLPGCLALDRASLGGLWSEAQWRQELADGERPGMGLFQGNELLALATGWLVLEELHITAVAVAPAWRRRGLGRRALAALLLQGRDLGAERATLEVAASNPAARALYAATGFRTAGVRRNYYRNGDDALIEWLNLTGWRGAENR